MQYYFTSLQLNLIDAYIVSQTFSLVAPLIGGGGGVAQSIERATPGEEIPGSILAADARSLLVGSVSV